MRCVVFLLWCMICIFCNFLSRSSGSSSNVYLFLCVLSLQTEFPANTNILYIDLPSAEKIGSSQNATCLPGMILNLKKPIIFNDHLGIPHRYYLSFRFDFFTCTFTQLVVSLIVSCCRERLIGNFSY